MGTGSDARILPAGYTPDAWYYQMQHSDGDLPTNVLHLRYRICLFLCVITWLQLDLVCEYQPSDWFKRPGSYISQVICWKDGL